MTTVWRWWQRITWRRGRKHWTSCNSSPMISWPLWCPLSLVSRPPATCLPGERGMQPRTLPGLRKDFVRACDTPNVRFCNSSKERCALHSPFVDGVRPSLPSYWWSIRCPSCQSFRGPPPDGSQGDAGFCISLPRRSLNMHRSSRCRALGKQEHFIAALPHNADTRTRCVIVSPLLLHHSAEMREESLDRTHENLIGAKTRAGNSIQTAASLLARQIECGERR